jgi:hypothetical protein
VERLGRLLLAAGFVEARVVKASGYELWALGITPDADRATLLTSLRNNGLAQLVGE